MYSNAVRHVKTKDRGTKHTNKKVESAIKKQSSGKLFLCHSLLCFLSFVCQLSKLLFGLLLLMVFTSTHTKVFPIFGIKKVGSFPFRFGGNGVKTVDSWEMYVIRGPTR